MNRVYIAQMDIAIDAAGEYVFAGGLEEEPEQAFSADATSGTLTFTDGPFVEGKEVVSGYVEIEADDLDEVLQAAMTWPGCPVVEVRPIEFESM